ncbi:hypothetical protein ACFPYN_05460 [Paenisporosarcina macmurdoensis]|uniref:Uncharacterized protein n=1 Tax=Paenisporosarcina macmurdoensis TaxID=212659 RepID=A0ABW1L6Q1_9BACL
MKMLKTVDAAKKEIKELQDFVFLVENYEVKSVEQKILKEYAYSGSIVKVVANINNEFGLDTIDHTFVSDLLKSKPQDELHKRMKAHYLDKTRHTRKKPSKAPEYKAFQYIEQNYIDFKR